MLFYGSDFKIIYLMTFHRNIGHIEKTATADFLARILSCQLLELYPEAIHYSFLQTGGSTISLLRCIPGYTHIERSRTKSYICGHNNIDGRIETGCHVKVEAGRKCFNHQNVTECAPEMKPFISRLRHYPDISQVKDCIKQVENQCKQKHITSAKILRTTMQSMEATIRKIPDVYIIYYVRDPRGIYMSRKGLIPFDALCSQMERNHQIYLKLKDKYPDVIHFMRYEDLAMDTKMTVSKMFTFLNESIPLSVQEEISEQTNSDTRHGRTYRNNSTYTAISWRDKISEIDYQTSIHECGDILKMLNYVA